MAAGAMPIPNMNPTGVIGSGSGNVMPGSTGTPFSTFMPGGTGGAGNMGFGNTANPNPATPSGNPYMAHAAGGGANPTSTPSATPASATPAGLAPVGASPAGAKTMTPQGATVEELQNTYGSGMGQLIYQYLQSNGGYNSQATQLAVDGQINGMGQQVQLGADNLTSMLGASGVSAGSSEFSGVLTNYENAATTQENAITSQEYYNMWNDSQNREVSVLENTSNNVATEKANENNWMDDLSTALGIGSSVGGTVMNGLALSSLGLL